MSVWSDLKEALRGGEHDFTEGTVGRAILLLSVPMVLEMAMESLFGLVDVFFVAKLGSEAAAAVGLADSLMTLVFTVAMGLAMATTAVVARRIGEKDPEAAAHAAVQSIVLGLYVSVLLGLAGFLFSDHLLRAMGGDESLVRTGSGYAASVLGGSVVVVLLFLINAVFRGAGDAAIAMRVLWLGNGINILLDPCLIFGLGPFPELGVTGAGISTVIGRGTAVIYQLIVLSRSTGRVRIARRHLAIDVALQKHLLSIAWSGMFQFFVGTASWIALWRLMSTYGSSVMAGYTVAIRIVVFTILPAWGISNAAATLVGQNLGAKKPERAERCVWLTGMYNMAYMVVVAAVYLILAEEIVGLISPDPAVRRYGADALRWFAYGYPFYCWGMVIVQSFNGAGDTRTPMLIDLFCYWLFQIPLAWSLSQAGYGPTSIYIAIASAESMLAVAGLIAFRRGTWKAQQV